MIEHLRSALNTRDVISEQSVEVEREQVRSRCAPLEQKIREMSRELHEKEREIHVSCETQEFKKYKNNAIDQICCHNDAKDITDYYAYLRF